MSNHPHSNGPNGNISHLARFSQKVLHPDQANNFNSKNQLQKYEIDSRKGSNINIFNESSHQKNPIIEKLIHFVSPQLQISRCIICEEICEMKQIKQFGPCHHSFCQNCLKQYASAKLQNFELIVCPEQNCKGQLSKISSFYQSVLSDQEKKKYAKIQHQLYILSNPHLRQCKKQNCFGIVKINALEQQNLQNKEKNFKCSQCKMEYCSLCFQEKHDGDCQKKIVKFLERNKKFRQCARCKRVIQKSFGCTHMTCLCGFYFCYMCGQQLKAGIHQCKVPIHLSCLQRVRWDIEHKQAFYQSNLLSFHRCLYCFELSGDIPSIVRFIYSLVYVLTIYPLSIAILVVILGLLLVLLFVLLFLFFILLPITELCSYPERRVTVCIEGKIGHYGLTLCIIMFYPIFVVIIMFDALEQICKDQQNLQEIQIFASEIGYGCRNILLMPFVLCANPKSLENQQKPERAPK